jgi:hypothetical protein
LLAEPAADTVSTVKQDPLQTVVHAASAGPGDLLIDAAGATDVELRRGKATGPATLHREE